MPEAGATIKDIGFVIGWVLAADGVDHVSVYLDNTYLQDAVVKGKRDDVLKLFPEFKGVEDVRFITVLQAESLPVGTHEISSRAVSRSGATKELARRTVKIEH